jgi:hypothetical protein
MANKNKLVCIFSQDMICIKFNHHGNEETLFLGEIHAFSSSF